MRLVVLGAVCWALVGLAGRPPASVAALTPTDAAPIQTRAFFPETGYSVNEGPLGAFFAARGGTRTFGPPLSNQFTLLGARHQIFRYFVLKEDSAGAVSTVNLLELGAVPNRGPDGQALPAVDPTLLSAAPAAGAAEYMTRVESFVRLNAPNQWEGRPVGFSQAFLDTVRMQDAFPSGDGNPALLPGMALEIWGFPVSRVQRDAQNQNLVYLRWERGVMAWNAGTGKVEPVPLGTLFKAVLTGEGLPPDLMAEVAGSRFYRQYQPSAPDGVAQPGTLPDTRLAGAFSSLVSEGRTVAGDTLPRGGPPAPGETAFGPGVTVRAEPNTPVTTPTPTTSGGFLRPGLPAPAAATPTPTVTPTQVTAAQATPTATASVDPCHGDEVISYVPSEPRVGNELLIVVSSARPHPYPRLSGTERTQFVRERQGQLGYVWEWTVQPTYPGEHEYVFYVDSTLPCQDLRLHVRNALATRVPR